MEQTTISKTTAYTIDTLHATVRFWVRHMMVSKVHGELGAIEGTVNFNPGELGESSVEATINAGSLSTGNEQRDGHLKSPDFLDVENFPTIKFKSTGITNIGGSDYEVTGDLTIHGEMRSVVLKAEVTPEVKGHFGGYVVGISATGQINREEFGIQWNQALEAGGVLVGKEIHIQIDAELTRPD